MTSLRSKDICLPIIGKPKAEALSSLRLPTNREVLQRLLYFTKVQKKKRSDSVNLTYEEIIGLWGKIAGQTAKGYNCFQSVNTIKKKLYG